MDIESLTAYLNASPEARALIAHLACKLAESEATLAALSAELAKQDEPKPAELAGFMTRDAILAVAHSALLSNVEVRAVIRFAPEEHRPDQTIVARPKRVCHDAEDELPILLDCYSWQYIFADRQEEGILTMEIV